MSVTKFGKSHLRYLSPDNLYEQIRTFTSGLAVTKDKFELLVPECTLDDFEWNHMDQMHRPSIHHTYEKGVRIALGKEFAVSLTQWGRLPLFITVTDVYVAKGLFYQSLTIAGVIFLHSIISMETQGDSVKLTDEWFIATHRFLKFLHKPLHKKLHKLNARLQDEDAQIRHGRFALRKLGYHFRSEPADYYSSNVLTQNTIYPALPHDATFSVADLAEKNLLRFGNVEFIVHRVSGKILIWPAACPHEGGPLANGKICEQKIICPWHSLQFVAVTLSDSQTTGSKYGFHYELKDDVVHIHQSQETSLQACAIA